MVGKDETIEVPSVGGREPRVLSRQLLAEILEPRVEEIFTLVNREMIKSGFENRIAPGVVITGGSAILPGMPELAEQIFNLPVRRGVPQEIGGLIDVVNSPIYATGVGLVKYGSRNVQSQEFRHRPGQCVRQGGPAHERVVRGIFLNLCILRLDLNVATRYCVANHLPCPQGQRREPVRRER